jgi:hypothetical protein
MIPSPMKPTFVILKISSWAAKLCGWHSRGIRHFGPARGLAHKPQVCVKHRKSRTSCPLLNFLRPNIQCSGVSRTSILGLCVSQSFLTLPLNYVYISHGSLDHLAEDRRRTKFVGRGLQITPTLQGKAKIVMGGGVARLQA